MAKRTTPYQPYPCEEYYESGEYATYDCSLEPVAVVGVPRAKEIAAGSSLTCALTVDGEVYAWGDVYSDQEDDEVPPWKVPLGEAEEL